MIELIATLVDLVGPKLHEMYQSRLDATRSEAQGFFDRLSRIGVRLLGEMGESAQAAVPELSELLDDKDDGFRKGVAMALRAIGTVDAIQAVDAHSSS